MAASSSKTAKHVVELGRDRSDDEGDASATFEQAQKKVRFSQTQNPESSEITLKLGYY